MENLLSLGFKQEFIDKLIEKEGFTLINALNNNYEDFQKILTLIKELHVEDIEDFIYENTSIFYHDYIKIREIIEKADLRDLIENTKEDNDYLAEYIYSKLINPQ